MTDPGLFSDESVSIRGGSSLQRRSEAECAHRQSQVRRSALWAAYGDALGWISELVGRRGLSRRTSGKPLRRPIEWKRRIGGRAGITASLPRGCYSDDSQLRLATGRAIRASGFDVEAFANVELPVWLSYGLGGGRATGVAAANLARANVPWFANTFKGWANSGGNGAAMRIQPHVWASAAPRRAEGFLPDVIRNAVCTHSHPRGLMGAVLHALVLAHTMDSRSCPSPDDILKAVQIAANLPDTIQGDPELGLYWISVFERESGSFDEGWKRVVTESEDAIQMAGECLKNGSAAERYESIIDRLDLRNPAQRGSGLLTAVAATALTWCEQEPEEALCLAANAIGTDTDTIATMAGAILGVVAETEPPVEILDARLFRAEADRLASIAQGGQPQSHRYPDLLHWIAPRTRSDAVGLTRDGGLSVRGLGRAEEKSEPIPSPRSGFMWQWLQLETGQTLLIKRRTKLTRDEEVLSRIEDPPREETERGIVEPAPQTDSVTQSGRAGGLNLQRAPNYIEDHNADDKIVGRALRQIVTKGTPAEIAGFTAGLIEIIRQKVEVGRSE